ncbi:MAG: sulfurtransferase [Deferribacterales bacterium]
MKDSLLRKGRQFVMAAAFVSALALLSACGGGGSYEAPTTPAAEDPNAWWTGYDVSDETAVSADDVAAWINNGFKTTSSAKTGAGYPVLIVDVQTDFSTTADRIIGSLSKSDITGFALDEYRAEGPIDSIDARATSARMATTGATMDKMIQDMGVTKDTVIVFTNSALSSSNYDLTRAWWLFYYWGFSESKIKVLDGGVAAVKAVDASLVDTSSASVDPADNTFSVKNLPGLHDAARVTTKNVIDLVRAGSVKVIDVRGAGTQGSVAFSGRIKGAVTGINAASVIVSGKFLDKTSGEALLTAAGVKSTDTIVVHCVSGYSATPVYYYIKEVLGYDNVALYDGSWSAWSSHAGYERGASYASEEVYWGTSSFMYYTNSASVPAVGAANTATSDTTGVIVALGGPLQSSTTNTGILAYDTFKLSTAAPTVASGLITVAPQTATLSATTSWKDALGVIMFNVNPAYTGTGNEIEETDKAYVASDDDTGDDTDTDDDSGSDDSGTTPSGPSGC